MKMILSRVTTNQLFKLNHASCLRCLAIRSSSQQPVNSSFSQSPPDLSNSGPNQEYKWFSWAIGLSLGAFAGYLGYKMRDKNVPLNATVYAATPTGTISNRSRYNFFADVVEQCAPAVVYIEIKDTRRYDYYSGQPLTASNGSGFIVDSNGLILTNAHVIINKPHTVVVVKLLDGRSFNGVVESVDPTSDLATVRIKCSGLPTMKLGKSSDLRAGEWVVALGSPLALSNTVTSGVVSSTQRASKDLGLQGRNINYIQTDAAITFGNSGGPLINLDGEAIGLNSMKVTAGISFAIPIDYVKEFLRKSKLNFLISYFPPEFVNNIVLPFCSRPGSSHGKSFNPHALRRYMGITMVTLTEPILIELRQRSHTMPADVASGVLVWKVIYGSPAHS